MNRLRALGFEDAVRELRDYIATAQRASFSGMCGTDPMNPDCAQNERVMLLMRLLFETKDTGAPGRPVLGIGLIRSVPQGLNHGDAYPLVVIGDLPFFLPEWLPGRTGTDSMPGPQLDWYAEHGKLRAQPLRPAQNPLQALQQLEKEAPNTLPGNDPLRQVWRALEDALGLAVPGPAEVFAPGAWRDRKRITPEQWNELLAAAQKVELYWDETAQAYRSHAKR